MAPLHQIPVVDDPVKPPHCEESSSEDDEEVVPSNGNMRTDEVTLSSRQSLRGDVTFPIKLHEMLMDVEREDNATIVSWSPDGKGFRVHKQTLFVQTILPRYFSQTKYRSFQRQLNHYGFDRILKGPYEGGYRHPDFVKDDPIRCRTMRRLKRHAIPKRAPLDETSSRHDDNSLMGNANVVAVSPEPSHHGSPKRDFESRRECLSTFQSPMFRPVPQYHRARIVTGPPLPMHLPGARFYYHNPPLSPPHVTHVYYVPPPPDFHHQTSPRYRIEYRPAVVDYVRPMYQAYHAKAAMPIMEPVSPHNQVHPVSPHNQVHPVSPHNQVHPVSPHNQVHPVSPHNQVHLRPAHEEIRARNPELFYGSLPVPTRKPTMGMVPVEEVEAITEPERPTVLSESYKPCRRKRHSFSSVNSNQEKSIDDLLLDFLSDDEQQGTEDEDGEILHRLTDGKNILLGRNPQSQYADDKPVSEFPHDWVYNPGVDPTGHRAHIVAMEANQPVAL